MDLREKYPIFYYNSFTIKEDEDYLSCVYNYQIGDYVFTPSVKIAKKVITNKDVDNNFLEYLFFNFGIINAINYYKLVCSKKMVIKCGFLEEEQKDFFKKLFYNGLSEMFYRNKFNLSYDEFLEIETLGKKFEFKEVQDTFKGNLIPVGGGKDSIVTLEYLKPDKEDNKIILYNRSIYPEDEASLMAIYKAGYQDADILRFYLELDPLMLKLNNEGFYNGHIPFSSTLAFASYITAYLSGKKYIVLSNEASANEGNVEGLMVNHQYSKSYEFEKDFRDYTFKYFSPYIEYFSLLRCFNELEIVKEFAKHPEYFPIFRSCNVGMKKNTWCAACAKCLYVTIMLYPFVKEEDIINIFGKNMLDNMENKDLFLGLISPLYDKPFECVGTKEEINYALSLALKTKEHLPKLLQFYKDNYYDEKKTYNVENYFNSEHFINKHFLKLMGFDDNEK